MSPLQVPLWNAIDEIRLRDGRYRREAYLFVVHALGVTVQGLPAERLHDPSRRHLSGRELLRGVVRLARGEFGAMAGTVFREWGVSSSEDVGEIVFQLVRSGQLSARPQDTIEDFRGGPDLLDWLERESEPGTDRPGARRAGPGGEPEPRG